MLNSLQHKSISGFGKTALKWHICILRNAGWNIQDIMVFLCLIEIILHRSKGSIGLYSLYYIGKNGWLVLDTFKTSWVPSRVDNGASLLSTLGTMYGVLIYVSGWVLCYMIDTA